MKGIRRKEKAIGEKSEMVANLKEAKYVTVAMCLDNEPYLGARFSINATPTFYVYRNGSKLGDVSGAVPKEQLYAWLDSLLLR